MSQDATAPPAPRIACSWYLLLVFSLGFIAGATLFFHPAVGSPRAIEIKAVLWQSPWAVAVALGAFCLQVGYLVWCFGLRPRGEVSTACRTTMAYSGFAVLAIWLAGGLAWALALIQMGYFAIIGVPLVLLSAWAIGSVLREVRRAADRRDTVR